MQEPQVVPGQLPLSLRMMREPAKRRDGFSLDCSDRTRHGQMVHLV